MSNEQIRLLESIRDGVHLLGEKLGGQIAETNTRLGSMDTRLGSMDTRLGSMDTRLGKVEIRLGNVERQLETTNNHLYTLVKMHSESSIALSQRADQSDKRITALEHRVDKLEETG